MAASADPPDTIHLWSVGPPARLGPVNERLSADPRFSLAVVPTDPGEPFDAEPAGDPPDCVLVDRQVATADDPTVVDRLRADWPALPLVVLGATEAGPITTDRPGVIHLPDGAPDRVPDVIAAVVPLSREVRATRDRANRFDALYTAANTFIWVLDADGVPIDRNPAAEALGFAPDPDPFWAAVPWAAGERPDVRAAIESALDGELSGADGRVETPENGPIHLELTCYPVERGPATGSEVLLTGRDVTDRAALEEELRRSERPHRITLNNMTDTVLVTDDAGEFTYICPNVHFIFGYAAEEVRELGTIDALLGDGLFDRTELARRGTLSNLEATVTDKHGDPHHLLVTVRDVDIQGGTTLYSCRDITTRKRREESLTALHRTARTLLYEDSTDGIGDRIVADASEVLDLPVSAYYGFDTERSLLRPVAASDRLSDSAPALPEIEATGRSLVGQVFVEGDSRFVDDVPGHSQETRLPGLASAAYVPLGDHGVFVAGTDQARRFSDVSRELTELLAATAEAALDRVEREQTLRKQEQELQRQNRRLTRLNQVNEIIRAIDRAVVEADSRDEIERAVCDHLTSARFAFAWIGEPETRADELRPRAWAGRHDGYLDSIDLGYREGGSEPAAVTAASGAMTTVKNVADGFRDEPWRTQALQRGYQSAISVPLAYDGFLYGVLTVYTGDRVDPQEGTQDVLRELGDTVASAISAVERKNALLAGASTEVEYAIADPAFPLIRLSTALDAPITTEGPLQQSEAGVYLYSRIGTADPERVGEAAGELTAIADCQLISSGDDHTMARLEIARPFIALSLVDHGVTLREIRVADGVARLHLTVPEGIDLQTVDQVLDNAFADPEIRRKRRVDGEPSAIDSAALVSTLTDRQLEVIQTAYHAGYFESPRENSGEEVAEALGISPPGFYSHVRAVERKVFTRLIEEAGLERRHG